MLLYNSSSPAAMMKTPGNINSVDRYPNNNDDDDDKGIGGNSIGKVLPMRHYHTRVVGVGALVSTPRSHPHRPTTCPRHYYP